MNSEWKEKKDVAHKSGWHTFEAVFGIPFFVAVLLQFWIPLSLPQGVFTPIVIPGGVALIIVGLVLIISARREFVQYDQPTDPGHPTRKLVTTGVFSVSRNSLYLGGICFIMGIGLAFDLPWVLALLLPAVIACHYILIVPEERYLAEKFGSKYHNYAAIVHRWIGRSRHRSK